MRRWVGRAAAGAAGLFVTALLATVGTGALLGAFLGVGAVALYWRLK